MTVGELTSFLLYTLIVAFSLGALSGLYADFMKAMGAAERVFELLDRPPGSMPAAAELARRRRVEFEGVRFSYPTRPDARCSTASICTSAPGEVVALVGPSGAGKSTIAALLARFYDPTAAGRARRHDAHDLEPSWLRAHIGDRGAGADPVLDHHRREHPLRPPRRVARGGRGRRAAAHAHDFVTAFPEG